MTCLQILHSLQSVSTSMNECARMHGIIAAFSVLGGGGSQGSKLMPLLRVASVLTRHSIPAFTGSPAPTCECCSQMMVVNIVSQ